MDSTGLVVGLSTLLLGLFYSSVSIGYLSSEVASLWSELDQEMGVLKVETDDLWVRIVQLGDPARGTIRRARRDYEKVIEGYNAKVEVPVFATDSIFGKSDSGDIPTLPPLVVPPTDKRLDTCSCNAFNTCPPGAPGQSGDAGEDGVPGVDGQDGFHGIDAVDSQNCGFYGCVVCPTGAPGSKGRQGHTGMRGPRGVTGEPGRPGRNGHPGLPGDMGPQGTPGPDGKGGIRGPNGRDALRRTPIKGHKGPMGYTGPVGKPGSAGSDGLPGPEGPPGLQGMVGLSGTPGDEGEDGPPGGKGKIGPDAEYCPCPEKTAPAELERLI